MGASGKRALGLSPSGGTPSPREPARTLRLENCGGQPTPPEVLPARTTWGAPGGKGPSQCWAPHSHPRGEDWWATSVSRAVSPSRSRERRQENHKERGPYPGKEGRHGPPWYYATSAAHEFIYAQPNPAHLTVRVLHRTSPLHLLPRSVRPRHPSSNPKRRHEAVISVVGPKSTKGAPELRPEGETTRHVRTRPTETNTRYDGPPQNSPRKKAFSVPFEKKRELFDWGSPLNIS